MSVSLPPDLNLSHSEPLARHTSLKVGGPADLFVLARSFEQAIHALATASNRGLPVHVIGGGSNLLPADTGIDGLVIKYAGDTHEVQVHGDEAVVLAEAGCKFAGLARRLAREGWGGLEWAVNVPGTVGGAAVNNAGAFGGHIAEQLIAVEIADTSGHRFRLARDKLDYGYRTSGLKRREFGPTIVLRADLALRRDDPTALRETVAQNQGLRTRTQPRQLSAGSVFANPEGDYSGRLIEAAGLKGARQGGAQISPQHANFIVNLGGATASDVYHLMRLAQETVWQQNGIWLCPEIELIGRWTAERLAGLRGPSPQGGAG